ncbi:MAG TPA: FKBP-type peptidyl-prolyl cis-trans isomerase [Chryseolinea sp.]|nr:FKBP-type peptidyl-prolyl cis-trans isomerase [Chryseolinea sp.]
MIRILSALIVLTLICASCAPSEKETPNGFKYVVISSGDGVLPKKEQVIVFDYLLRDSKDSVWSDTYSQGIPVAIPIPDSSAIPQEKGMFQMFRMLSKGDSVRVTLPLPKFFLEVVGRPAPMNVDSSLSLSYFLKIRDIMEMEAYREFQMGLLEKRKDNQISKDALLIEKYLSEKSITAQTDSSGIRYVIHTAKGGAKPDMENCVEVSYKGSFLNDGAIFDQNPKMAFPLSRVIEGWQLAIPLLGIGDSATFYIPSALGYGAEGAQGVIPPDAILIFDVTLLGFGSNFDPNTGSCN